MNFGQAIEAMRNGLCVQRQGWNGKAMYLYLEDWSLSPAYYSARAYKPCIVMFTASKEYQPGWLASQDDILAEDWLIFDVRS